MMRNQYLRHLVLSMGTRIAMIALRLLRNMLLARILGPADRGLFALLSALPELIAAFTSGGLNSAIGYHAARQKPMGVLLTQVLVFGCLLAWLATLVGVMLVKGPGSELDLARNLGDYIWLLLVAVPLLVLRNALLNLHNADGKVGAFNGLRLGESFGALLLFLLLYWLWRDAPLSAAIGSWLAALLLVAIAGAVLLTRFHRVTLHWDSPSQFELLRYGGKSHFEILFQQMLMRCDYLLIAALMDNQALGYYVMASAAAELLCIVPEAVTTPLMKRLLQQGQGITQLTPLALRLTGTAMLLACLAMALLGEWLIVLLFGEAYRPAYPALLALLPGIFCLGHGSILRLDLLGKQRPGSLSLYTGCAAGLNLALTLALLPHFGIVGAAISSSIAYSTLSLAMLLLYCRLSGVAIGQTLLAFPSDLRILHAQLRPAT